MSGETDFVHWVGWTTQALIHIAESDDHEQAVEEAKVTLRELLAGGVPYGPELRRTVKQAARKTAEPARRIHA